MGWLPSRHGLAHYGIEHSHSSRFAKVLDVKQINELGIQMMVSVTMADAVSRYPVYQRAHTTYEALIMSCRSR